MQRAIALPFHKNYTNYAVDLTVTASKASILWPAMRSKTSLPRGQPADEDDCAEDDGVAATDESENQRQAALPHMCGVAYTCRIIISINTYIRLPYFDVYNRQCQSKLT